MIQWTCAFATCAALAAVLMSLYRLLIGPAMTDRILALDTLAINAIGLIVLMGVAWGTKMYFEAAILFAMVGFLSAIAFCKYLQRGDVID